MVHAVKKLAHGGVHSCCERRPLRSLCRLSASLFAKGAIVAAMILDATYCSSAKSAHAIPSEISPEVKGLIEDILSQDFARRHSAVALLSRMQNDAKQAAVPFLVRLLDDKDASVRTSAIVALGCIPDSRSLEPLLGCLRDTKAEVRYMAAGALGKLTDRRAVESLIKLLTDSDAMVRESAASALRKIPDARAFSALLAGLNDPIADVRCAVVWAIGELRDARAVDELIAVVEHDVDHNVADGAAWALGQIGDSRAVEPLLAALHRSAPNTSRMVLLALGDLHDQRARSTLTTVATSRSQALADRMAATRALGMIADGRVAETLVTIWQNDKEPIELRLVAAIAIGDTRDHHAVDAMAFILERNYRSCSLAAVKCLSTLNDPRASDLLRKSLKHRDPLVRIAVDAAIKQKELSRTVAESEDY
jgi:HEAT repeat protein